MSTITLTEDYGYTQYDANGLADGTVIDASGATFIQDNNTQDDGRANPYPVAVSGSSNIVLEGGTVLGDIDQTTDRDTVYHFDPGNSAGVRAEDAPGIVIRDWRIDNTWDGIRVSWNTQDFVIEDVWISDARDDAIENDKLNSGTIRNCLFDGVMNGISLDPSSSSPVDGNAESVTLDGVLMRMQIYLSEGETTHGTPIKVDKDLGIPDLHITNCVFAIEDVTHNGMERLGIAWENVVESSNNVFLNLSDKPLPADYPMPPKGWTVLQGQEARDYWNEARDAWIEAHENGTDAPVPTVPDYDPITVPDDEDPIVPDPDDQTDTPVPDDDQTDTPVPDDDQTDTPAPGDDGTSAPAPGDATFEGVEYEGANGDGVIIGNELDNYIDGNNGDDIIKGGAGDDTLRSDNGADQLWGNSGSDTFYFKHASDSRDGKGIDTIMDFADGDRIDISNIDADRDARGDQAFELITGEITDAGQLSVNYDAAIGCTVVQCNVDDELRPEVTIWVDGQVDLTTSDFIL